MESMMRVGKMAGQRLEYAMMVTSTTKDWFLAIQPMLHMSHKDLWQLYMLDA